MLVRTMVPEDVLAVVEIERQCFSQPWSEKSFEESITREDTIFLVCKDAKEEIENDNAGIIAGYIGMYLSFEEASITNVAVSPEFRRKGIGESLVKGAKSAAKEAGAEHVFLEVRVSNMPAILLYEKMGFENLGIRKNFYEHPKEDAYIMRCDITK